MNKVVMALLVLFVLLSAGAPVQAREWRVLSKIETQQPTPQPKQNFWDRLMSSLKKLSIKARVTGTITAIDTDTLKIQTRNKVEYTVFVDNDVQLRRRFWGKADLSEFAVGDSINVVGDWKDQAHTQISADLIRDTSVFKRTTILKGTVQSKTNDAMIVQTLRDNVTVYIDPQTQIVNRNGVSISYIDVSVGHSVRIKGVYDSKTKEVKNTQEIKDLNKEIKHRTSNIKQK